MSVKLVLRGEVVFDVIVRFWKFGGSCDYLYFEDEGGEM